MFVVKKNRLLVYRALFREGVLVAKKDNYGIWVDVQKNDQGEVVDENKIPNLEVMNLLKSLKSSGYVKETFNWQYYYWYLTEDGLEFLRKYLHIPTDGERAIVPATHKKAPPKGRPGLGGGERQDRYGDKPKRFGEPGGDFKPGYGRGRDNYRSDRGGDRAPFGRGS